MELSVSILNSKDRINTTKILNNSNMSYLHIDVMDGKFVSQKTFLPSEIKEMALLSHKKLDIHLMVKDPISYIEKLKDLPNIEYITIHLEIAKDIKNILNKIREFGFKSGLSIKPNTDVSKLLPYLDCIDLILVMTVEPGLGGQPFIKSSPAKLEEVRNLIQDYNIKIEVDGGINNETIKEVSLSDIAVVGSYITSSDNPLEKINSLLV
ncbi:MAG: ribulose-phosphate 3-epimerase [Bacilli bacterium]